jgi:hypothetical protein
MNSLRKFIEAKLKFPTYNRFSLGKFRLRLRPVRVIQPRS